MGKERMKEEERRQGGRKELILTYLNKPISRYYHEMFLG